MRNQIQLDEVLDAGDFALKASIYKVAPGIVTAYHAGVAGKSQPSVDVQPATHDVRVDPVTGVYFEKWPIIPQVPLAMLLGGGGGIALALNAGDKVTLLSFDLDPTVHRGTGNAENPIHTSRHGGAYWIALPFDITDKGAQADPGGDLVVTPPTGGHVVVGPGAAEFAALANLVDQAVTTIVDAFNGHTHVVTGTCPSGGGALTVGVTTTLASKIAPAPGSVACTVLKVL